MSITRSLGICIGASNISFVVLDATGDGVPVISSEFVRGYRGNPKSEIRGFVDSFDLHDTSVVITGRKFRRLINNSLIISEPEAIEHAVVFSGLAGNVDAIASLGGENFIVYCLDVDGKISKALTGNKCASGTGEFFQQQLGRMNLTIPEAMRLSDSSKPHKVSGRCSVFCKSDCTHALNKGVPKNDVVAGLCEMLAGKVSELLAKQPSSRVAIIGGVSSNTTVIKYLKSDYPDTVVPASASCFEALGAAVAGLKTFGQLERNDLFKNETSSFAFHSPLDKNANNVEFKTINRETAVEGDVCIVGLDVGSTTTKAVLLRRSDHSLLASAYLRTNGNPVAASLECYNILRQQVSCNVSIEGLGTTGSGRHIAGLHALTEGVINEIVAHAVAASYFNNDVDTIFEIGGQDAKYTFLTNGVASDYAMNEACSAGTGSFLEESAKETLGISCTQIAEIALEAVNPPNFNDQCAAFISSDIKNAIHEGISKPDIIAGLVYSICLNYVNRVKGNRPIGNVIFMQGGVCYNRAVPIAMAQLTGKKIIVPPEPGLMGAFGVALEIDRRIDLGLLSPQSFSLEDLISRSFDHTNDFNCPGTRENCDLGCEIAIYEVEGKKYPFGGACNKYFNQRLKVKSNPLKLDFIKKRQDLIFDPKFSVPDNHNGKTVGLSRSFMTNNLYPLYATFLNKLGYKIVLSDDVEKRGIDRVRSSFCYPVELSHGMFENLIQKDVDFIFMPHLTELKSEVENDTGKLCPFVQGESYYLKTAFKDTDTPKLVNPVINLNTTEKEVEKQFVRIAKDLGHDGSESTMAFNIAWHTLNEVNRKIKELGREALLEIDKDEKFGMVLLGRSYNAIAVEANMGIPHKIASKNVYALSQDMLPLEGLKSLENMYWYSGNQIIRASRFIRSHPDLFAVYVTNFSCGPDSFIISYFRRIMSDKPSLTLELDSHSADVGIDTRLDAAIDIIRNYREIKSTSTGFKRIEPKLPKLTKSKGTYKVLTGDGREYDLTHPDIEVLIPSMGRYSAEAFAAAFRYRDINAKALPVPSQETLKMGRSNTSCKECLPYILTAGSLLEDISDYDNSNGKMRLFFMPTGKGPCRLGQYATQLSDMITDLGLRGVGVIGLSSENSFGDLGTKFTNRGWLAVLISDLITDMENTILSLAIDKRAGLDLLDNEWQKLLTVMESGSNPELYIQLEQSAKILSTVPLKHPLNEAKVISLIGEIYVRREEFSRMDLIELLVENGFVVRTAPITEFVFYTNYLALKHKDRKVRLKDKASILVKEKYQRHTERKVKAILSRSGLINPPLVEIEKTIAHANHLLSDKLTGEAILTTGMALREIVDEACGVISIGPFGCMPSRLAESLLNTEMSIEGKLRSNGYDLEDYPENISTLPFLHLETDGNPFPQIIQSRIEIFMLQAESLHAKLMEKRRSKEEKNIVQ